MTGNLYDTLGVDQKASTGEIRRAYRKKAAKAHPDVGGSRDEWDRVQRALTVLTNPETRERYNRTGDDEAAGPDLGPAIIRQMVMMAVEHVIDTATKRGMNPEEVDIIADAARFMRTKIEEGERAITAKEKEAAAIRKLAKRFKAKKGRPNVIGTMFEARAADLIFDCEPIRRQIEHTRDAIKMLGDHTFDWTTPGGYSDEAPMTRGLSWFQDAMR